MIPVINPNPTTLQPVVTIGIIIICVFIFLWEISLDPKEITRAIYYFSITPALFLHRINLAIHSPIPIELTLITSMFFHANWLHLAGNLLFFWIFGKTIEDAMGHIRFILFYLLCGSIATMSYILIYPTSYTPVIGASGAISAVLGAYFRLFPRSKIIVFYLHGIYPSLTQVPAGLVLIIWYGLQLLYPIFVGTDQETVTWEIHLSGFAAGMLLVPLFHRTIK
ncbi:rhomboid family protein [Candidatus Nitrosoglobus terrae]|uniref:Rhomboid family protein n=1 Tax=Candidatus Nitrosoglobus terrae TaxID=1630141 RepID=A0A1Q2SNU0_9GAMM|nr:rhomboid family intramembrane serine protease [Candidatus Nitrosoglobus terrae]BAW80767.1 rhomboid family protein [Candidatus Nitrosoglobus terrae]